MIKFLLLILGLSLNVYGADKYPTMKDEYQNIEDMINKLESDIEPPSQANTPKETPPPIKEFVVPVTQPKVVETKVVEPKVVEPKNIETKTIEPKVVETKAVEPQIVEPKVVEPKIVETKVVEPKVVETKAVEPQIVEPKVVEAQKIEPQFSAPQVIEPQIMEPQQIAQPQVAEPQVIEPQFVAPQIAEPQIVEPKIVEAQKIEPQVVAPQVTETKVSGIKSYIDEKSGKNYKKQIKIREGLKGTSVYESTSRSNDVDKEGVYHFAYMPPVNTDGFNEEGVYDGKVGHFVFNVYGDYVLYYKALQNRNTWGADFQIGGQFDIKPFALALMMDGSMRGANATHVKLYGIGPRLRASYRFNSWVYPFIEGGLEFAKLENKSQWVKPFTVLGGGAMFRLGKVDRKAEINLHKDFNVSQILFVISAEILTSPELSVETPDCALIKAGLAIEFF
ncbi:MAG: hypothetical protein WCQ47_06350 [bacterium]